MSFIDDLMVRVAAKKKPPAKAPDPDDNWEQDYPDVQPEKIKTPAGVKTPGVDMNLDGTPLSPEYLNKLHPQDSSAQTPSPETVARFRSPYAGLPPAESTPPKNKVTTYGTDVFDGDKITAKPPASDIDINGGKDFADWYGHRNGEDIAPKKPKEHGIAPTKGDDDDDYTKQHQANIAKVAKEDPGGAYAAADNGTGGLSNGNGPTRPPEDSSSVANTVADKPGSKLNFTDKMEIPGLSIKPPDNPTKGMYDQSNSIIQDMLKKLAGDDDEEPNGNVRQVDWGPALNFIGQMTHHNLLPGYTAPERPMNKDKRDQMRLALAEKLAVNAANMDYRNQNEKWKYYNTQVQGQRPIIGALSADNITGQKITDAQDRQAKQIQGMLDAIDARIKGQKGVKQTPEAPKPNYETGPNGETTPKPQPKGKGQTDVLPKVTEAEIKAAATDGFHARYGGVYNPKNPGHQEKWTEIHRQIHDAIVNAKDPHQAISDMMKKYDADYAAEAAAKAEAKKPKPQAAAPEGPSMLDRLKDAFGWENMGSQTVKKKVQ